MSTLDELLTEMMATEHASDLHLSVGEPPILRIAGTLTRTDAPPLTVEAMETLLSPILSPDEMRVPEGITAGVDQTEEHTSPGLRMVR